MLSYTSFTWSILEYIDQCEIKIDRKIYWKIIYQKQFTKLQI